MWAVGILVLAVGMESMALRTAAREANRVRGGESWWDYIRRAKNPELPVVLLEDLGAVTGLLFALAGVGLAMLTGDGRFDAAGSIAIGVLLGVIAFVLAVEMKSLLIGESARPSVSLQIRDAIAGAPHVRRILDLRTLHIGPDELLVTAKVELDGDLTFSEVARVVDETQSRVRAEVPAARFIYLEPDVEKPMPS
jgi:divalent metal cation (Fe/Co/Zn/Cd) transporter